jgi:hypothetical protein
MREVVRRITMMIMIVGDYLITAGTTTNWLLLLLLLLIDIEKNGAGTWSAPTSPLHSTTPLNRPL